MATANGVISKRTGSVSLRQHEERVAFLFLLPWLIGFLAFTAFPIVASLFLSLTEYPILHSPEFVGLRNYAQMVSGDPLFWQSLKVTTIYTVAIVPLQLVTAYALAILLNQTVHGLSVFRTVFFLPAVTPAVATALMWMWVFHPEIGLANSALAGIGIEGPKWLASTEWALPTFIIISLWGIGGGMVIYLAGLQGVPTSLYEAAELDGAGLVVQVYPCHPADDVASHSVRYRDEHDRLISGLHRRVRDDRRRACQRHPLFRVASLQPRLAFPADGLCFGPGLGTVHHHSGADPSAPAPVRSARIL